MFKLIRNFMIMGVLGVILVTVLLGHLYREVAVKNTIELGVRENVAFSKMFINNIWPEFEPFVNDMKDRSGHELSLHPALSDFKKAVRIQSAGLEILNIHVNALNGNTIFSTDTQQLGSNRQENAGFKEASGGQVATETAYRDQVNSQHGLKLGRNIIINYVPVYIAGNSKIKAVFEIHSDITQFMHEIDRNQNNAYFVISGILSILLCVLYFVVKYADKNIKRHAAQIEDQQKIIESQLYHDSLTGLPNRTLFMDLLKQAMQKAQEKNQLLGLLFIDLHGFENVNDTLGYAMGDSLQLQVSQRLKQCVRKEDSVARFYGSEFVIILEPIFNMDEVEEIVRKLLEAISEPFCVDGNELFLTPSVGITLYPFADDSIDTLIKNAKVAMHQARNAGRNTYRLYCPTMSRKSTTLFSMERALRKALEREEFELHYQPLMQLQTGKILGVEALVRWRSPELGLIPPLDFIPLLEETGLIMPVGQWILESACQQGVKWQQQGIPLLKVNVNVSAVQFLQKGIINQVINALEMSGLKSQLLDLEITESLLINDATNSIKTLDALNELGVALSVDDFGTGYSSLSYLKRIPIETLKVDKSFIRDIAFDTDDAAIVDAICSLSRSLRLNIIAEGVETHEQLNFLRNLGVGTVQGYLLSRPLPASELTEILRNGCLIEFKESAA